MKKHVLSVIALIIAAVSLAVSVMSALAVQDMSAQLSQLQRQIPQSQQVVSTEPAAIPTPEPTEAEATGPVAEYEHYANLIVSNWNYEDNTLAISAAFAQVMAGTNVGISSVRTVVMLNGTEVHTTDLAMHPGEAAGSYELDLDDAYYVLPELAEGDHVEYVLDVVLSDGCTLLVCGASWDYAESQLLMIAG